MNVYYSGTDEGRNGIELLRHERAEKRKTSRSGTVSRNNHQPQTKNGSTSQLLPRLNTCTRVPYVSPIPPHFDVLCPSSSSSRIDDYGLIIILLWVHRQRHATPHRNTDNEVKHHSFYEMYYFYKTTMLPDTVDSSTSIPRRVDGLGMPLVENTETQWSVRQVIQSMCM